MNVIFHTATALAIAIVVADKSNQNNQKKNLIFPSCLAFIIGIISHGILDYIPHCYPIHSKIDVAFGMMMITFFTWLANKQHRLIVVSAFLGSIFPDLVDLLPAMINKYLSSYIGFKLPLFDKVFPWHFHEYSGSIYYGSCGVSTFNHIVLLLILIFIGVCRRDNMRGIFGNKLTLKLNKP